ncbi:MAG: chitobiase/beta-hexosaminidase C-terminal domain-containing protein [Fibrobacterota bacterium]|nr:MAG: chitobiase/beta-hexosaminidase C-terminal domain-containing protein [Fibrobacterota bacterium]
MKRSLVIFSSLVLATTMILLSSCDSGSNSTVTDTNPPKDTGALDTIAMVFVPVFSPSGGNFSAAQTVTISSATSGATIYYTVDGSTPSITATKYTTPVTVSASMTLKALALKSDMVTSSVGTANFTIQTPDTAIAPILSPSGGAYSEPQSVTISSATEGASIYYTTDGKAPSTSSTKYTSPVTVSSAQTLNAIAVKTGMAASPVGSAMFTYFGTMKYAGVVYKTVTIGTQTWMAENLRYKIDSSWWYKGSADSGAKYGLLYTWQGAMNLHDSCESKLCGRQVREKNQGICPSGWHIPSFVDWRILEANFKNLDEVSTELKSTANWLEGKNGTDFVGFSAQPGGERTSSNSYFFVNSAANFWSSSENSPASASYFTLLTGPSLSATMVSSKENGYSIRCIKD